MSNSKYITIEVSKLDEIIIHAYNTCYGSHSGNVAKVIKEALIENSHNPIQVMIDQVVVQIQQQNMKTASNYYDIPTLESCLAMLNDKNL